MVVTVIAEETFRGGVHAAAASLFAVMTAYNLMRLLATGAPRNAINVGLYGPLTCFEWYQAHHHWSQR